MSSVQHYEGHPHECLSIGPGLEMARPFTEREAQLWTFFTEFIMLDTHGTYHDYLKFRAEKAQPHGYEAMEVADEFAALHPEQVIVAGVDDDRYMSSSLVFIAHGTDENFMGLTAEYIPQSPLPAAPGPLEFFLYPGHARSVVEAITKLCPHLECDEVARYLEKPTAFDAIREGWRKKKWWLNRLPQLRALQPDLFPEEPAP